MAKVGNYNGSRTPTAKAERIVNLLGQGLPVVRIAAQCQTSQELVRDIRETRAVDILERKAQIRASAARCAADAFDMLNERLHSEKIATNLLIPIAGMAVDKVVALSPPPDQQLNVTHTLEPSQRAYEAFNRLAEAMKGSKGVQSSAAQAPTLSPIQEEQETVIDVYPQAVPSPSPDTGQEPAGETRL